MITFDLDGNKSSLTALYNIAGPQFFIKIFHKKWPVFVTHTSP
jgi:hypothetical protein